MRKFLTVFLAGSVLVLWGVWLTAPWWMHSFNVNWNFTEVGPWGDSFGVINALFSGLGFVAVVRTLMLQSDQLAAQQLEIDKQQKRLDASDRTAQIEQFERTFFQLLGLFREARDQVLIRSSGGAIKEGREAFELAQRALLSELSAHNPSSHDQPDLRKIIATAYNKKVHSGGEQSLGPYYRLLYTLLRRISENPILEVPEKAKYGNLVRSQLSSAEVTCITANALTKDANNFIEYLEEFRIPRYLPKEFYRGWIGEIYKPESLLPRD